MGHKSVETPTDTIHQKPAVIMGLKDSKNFQLAFISLCGWWSNRRGCSMSQVFGDIIVVLSSRAAIGLMITCPPWFGESKVSKRQIQHDPTVADGYVRYVCLGLRRRLVVNVMTYVGLWVHACVRACLSLNPLFQLPQVCRGGWGVCAGVRLRGNSAVTLLQRRSGTESQPVPI